MLSAKSIQRLYKPTRLEKFPAVKKLRDMEADSSSESAANDTNLSQDKVLEIYDWIAQINSQSNGNQI